MFGLRSLDLFATPPERKSDFTLDTCAGDENGAGLPREHYHLQGTEWLRLLEWPALQRVTIRGSMRMTVEQRLALTPASPTFRRDRLPRLQHFVYSIV